MHNEKEMEVEKEIKKKIVKFCENVVLNQKWCHFLKKKFLLLFEKAQNY